MDPQYADRLILISAAVTFKFYAESARSLDFGYFSVLSLVEGKISWLLIGCTFSITGYRVKTL